MSSERRPEKRRGNTRGSPLVRGGGRAGFRQAKRDRRQTLTERKGACHGTCAVWGGAVLRQASIRCPRRLAGGDGCARRRLPTDGRQHERQPDAAGHRQSARNRRDEQVVPDQANGSSECGPVSSTRARRPGPACSSARARSASGHRAALTGQPHRAALGVATVAAPAEAGQLGPEIGERMRQLQPGGAGLEDRDGLLEQAQPRSPPSDAPPREATSRCTWRADLPASPSGSRASSAAVSCSPSERQRGRGQCPPVARPAARPGPRAAGRSAAGRRPLANRTLSDAQAGASDGGRRRTSGLGDAGRGGVGSSSAASSSGASLDRGQDRDREKLGDHEMRRRDQPQAGLGLDLGIVKRPRPRAIAARSP